MDDRKDGILMIPYVVYEAAQTRAERIGRRLIAVIAICVILIVISNLAWLCAWTSYDYVGENSGVELEADRDGIANYIGTRGDIINGSENSGVSSQSDQN